MIIAYYHPYLAHSAQNSNIHGYQKASYIMRAFPESSVVNLTREKILLADANLL